MSVSLCMIVKNEEENLARCLDSVKGLTDEIVLVDTGSADGTVAAAERYGARVYRFPWNDSFSDARNFSLSRASGTWILVMDADDELERADREALLALTREENGETDIYCCRTLCYSGCSACCGNALINMSVRLIRNGKGYRYRGRVHEQIVRCGGTPGEPIPMAATGIRFHHYGYLDDQIAKKEKHRRNISLIEKELREDPKNGFMLFNLGNEYLSMGDAARALDCYQRSLDTPDPLPGYGSVLLTRMILCCGRMNREKDLFRYIRQGLELYPGLTDFEFLRADALQRRGKYLEAIRAYRKCLRMGEPPDDANSVCGVGTFKPHEALSAIFQRLGDWKAAERHCRAAIRFQPACGELYGRLCDLLLAQGRSPERSGAALLRLSDKNASACGMISDLLYDRRLYGPALRMAVRARRLDPESAAAYYGEGVCRFYLGQYRRAGISLRKGARGEYAGKASLFRLLCAMFGPGTVPAGPESFRAELSPAWFRTATALRSLLAGGDVRSLREEGEDPEPYEEPVFGLLEILLRAGRLEDFMKAVPLLNQVGGGDVLLRLGKLYGRYGYARLAYHELKRSIQLTGRIDAEGLALMAHSLPAAERTPHGEPEQSEKKGNAC